MKRIFTLTLLSLILTLNFTQKSSAHCEIPCGIYEDQTRISLIKEHITTIDKSIKVINDMTSKSSFDYNQLVRWIMNKEEHANKIQEIVTQYFMTQRIKYSDSMSDHDKDMYNQQLSLLHQMLVLSMKCKQSTDLKNTDDLLNAVEAFEAIYFHKH